MGTLTDAIRGAAIRRKARLHETPLDRWQVRVARTVDEYLDAFRLVQAAYIAEGIAYDLGREMRITVQHVLPETTVLVAYEREALVGTMTVTMDSPAGLPLDHDYPIEIEALREAGARLVELGTLAVVRRCQREGVTHLMNIAAYRIALKVHRGSHFIMGINPRAEAIYRAIYGFVPLGAPQPHAELNAPVLGMALDLVAAQPFIRQKFPTPMRSGQPAIEHFLGAPLPCLDVPDHLSLAELVRWKLPREVFQELFMRRSDRLATLDAATRAYLESRRSAGTLELSPEFLAAAQARAFESTKPIAILAALRAARRGTAK